MALPYPVDQMAAMQIPDPDNPYPPPPAAQHGGYPLAQSGYPPPARGYPPQQPGQSQQPSFPTAEYPPPPTNPGFVIPQPGYPPPQPGYPQSHSTYGGPGYSPYPQPDPGYGLAPVGYQAAPSAYPDVYPSSHPEYPPPMNPSYPPIMGGAVNFTGHGNSTPLPQHGHPSSIGFDESQRNSQLNEGLLSQGGDLLKLGVKAARKVNDKLGIFKEEVVTSGKPHHSYYEPETPSPTSSVPSYFADLTKILPKKANAVKVQNLRHDQDYMTLARQYKQSGKLWEDPAFPANSKVLTDGNMIVSYFGRRQVRDDEIQWLRPRDICRAMNLRVGPEMIVGERDRFDINQGEIGDCWFLAALANLADDDEMFNRVVPSGQDFKSNYCGIFRFRFFRFGEWVEVCVDDRLPTRNGQLIYIKAKDKNEFWSPLLEKAYAKLYGSYKALEGGLTIEAAVDFTGGIPEMISLSPLSMQPETLFYTMVKAYQANAFMSCSLSNSSHQRQAEQLGLQARHAYTITKVVEVRARGGHKGTIPLIRLRNPHGNAREWKGDWSDEDREWRNLSSSVKQSLGLTFDNDGEFYMSFNRDFLKYFGEVEIVHLTPTSMVEDQRSKVKYEVFYFHGEWRGRTAGGCGNDHVANFVQNPQFVFSLTDPDPRDDKDTCPVIISLAQKVKERKTEHAIGFRVYKLPPGQSQMTTETVARSQPVGKTDQYINLREVSKRLQLPPGNYCIIPTTFRPGQESRFLVRTFVERHWGSSGQAAGQSVVEGGEGGSGHQLGRRMTRNVINIPILREEGFAPPGGGEEERQGEGRKKKKRDQLADFAIGQIEKRCPKTGSFLAKLREWYSFPNDRDQEKNLLKIIVDSIRK